jgi:outer membrane cobalamin receptor
MTLRPGARSAFALVFAIAIAILVLPLFAYAAEPDGDDDDDDRPAPVGEIVVTARRLDQARADVSPALGASTYTLSSEAVEGRPGGETVPVGQLLSQAPGVAQAPSGRIVVRGQGELQYRINNVIIPEGITDIGDSLSTRLVETVDLVTGALPAQYGLQTGGVVNITTKNGVYNQGAQAELYGGSHGHFEPAYELVGHWGSTNLFSSGSYLRSDAGLSPADASANPLHDRTSQVEGLAFLDHVISADARASLVLGGSDEAFQLPHARGLDAATYPGAPYEPFARPLEVQGVQHFASEAWGGEERDSSIYAMATYEQTKGPVTLQASAFGRYSILSLTPDPVGDLLFTGVARAVDNNDLTGGVQIEAVDHLGARHTLRGGVVASWTASTNHAAAQALPVDAQGDQISDQPVLIAEQSRENRQETSAFLQDEWMLGGGFTLNPGLRFDHVSAQGGGDQFSPRLNLVWIGGAGLSLHAGYARYFVPAPELEVLPEPADLAGTTGASPSGWSDPLRAETDDDFDVGVQQKLEALTLSMDAYWRKARDLIDQAHVGATSLTQPFNYAQGRVRGVVLSATYAHAGLSLWANATAARAEGRDIVSGQAIFTPVELALASAGYVRTSQDQTWDVSAGGAYRWKTLVLSGQLAYGSGLPRTASGGAPDAASMPAHVQLDLSSSYTFKGPAGRPVEVRFDVINVADSRSQLQDASSLGRGAPAFALGRAFLVGVEQTF